MRKLVWCWLFSALVACGGTEKPKRVVLITLDTLRADALEGRGGALGKMPKLAERARGGALFARHYAASSTTQPTHASLLTGLHPWQHGVSRNGMVLDDAHETLAESFMGAGFQTAAIVASFPLHQRFGFDQGFDHYEDRFDRGRMAEWSGEPTDNGRFHSLGRSVTDRALALLDEHAEGSQFFWFHYFDPHEPYGDTRKGDRVRLQQIFDAAPSDPERAALLLDQARALYDVDVERLDAELDRLLARLDADAQRFETHVVLVSDHGESFGEDGALGHGTRLDEIQLRVPCVLLSPRASSVDPALPNGSVDVHGLLLALGGLAPLREPRAVFGMRRTYESPTAEPRMDGQRMILPDPWFFRVVEEQLLVGNGDFLQDVEGPAAEETRRFFAAFTEELRGRAVDEIVDEDTQRALEALGYTR